MLHSMLQKSPATLYTQVWYFPLQFSNLIVAESGEIFRYMKAQILSAVIVHSLMTHTNEAFMSSSDIICTDKISRKKCDTAAHDW